MGDHEPMTESPSDPSSTPAGVAMLAADTQRDLADASAIAPTLQRLADFADLAPDWDSYGGKTPTPAAIDAARRLLMTISAKRATVASAERFAPSWVSPLPSGGVQIDWNGPRAELEVDITPDGKIGYLLQEGHGRQATYEEVDDVAPARVLALVCAVLRSPD